MPEIRGITLSVGYGPLLAITLPRNMRHLTECWVITSLDDEQTRAVVDSIPGARLFVTDAMTRHGARMNKGLCFEECWDVMGRHGHMLIWDADILFPPSIPWQLLKPNYLTGCRRRMLEDPSRWQEQLNWRTLPVSRDGGVIGFFQHFAADDPAIKNKRPWYDVSFSHAGGGDAYFMTHWNAAHRMVLPFDVLHLGRTGVNWFGTNQRDRDMMGAFVHRYGWRGAMAKHDPGTVNRVPEIVERVEVPGYEPTGYELPFVRRAKQNVNPTPSNPSSARA